MTLIKSSNQAISGAVITSSKKALMGGGFSNWILVQRLSRNYGLG
jgi:hypothetical protein